MRYMLDTNMIAYAINKRPEAVLARWTAHDPEEFCISAITLAELEFGVCKSSRPEQNRLALFSFLARIPVLPFDADAAKEYGDIRQTLSKRGCLIGANDLLIAAHARAKGLTLVTNNEREFSRVDRLTIENWASEN